MIVRLICLFLSLNVSLFAEKVGLLVMGTGRYLSYAERVVESGLKYFLPNHEVTFFLFTDGTPNETLQKIPNVVCVHQERLGWPYDSMKRYHVYYKHRETLLQQDYLFSCDADSLFVDYIGDEILGDRVATLHCGFLTCRGDYETNPRSAAYVNPSEGEHYFSGAIYGGTAEEMMEIARTLANQVDRDLDLGCIAKYWDESHWNRYCIDHKPTVILSPSYWYTENGDLPYPKKILAIIKDHDALRAP